MITSVGKSLLLPARVYELVGEDLTIDRPNWHTSALIHSPTCARVCLTNFIWEPYNHILGAVSDKSRLKSFGKMLTLIFFFLALTA